MHNSQSTQSVQSTQKILNSQFSIQYDEKKTYTCQQ